MKRNKLLQLYLVLQKREINMQESTIKKFENENHPAEKVGKAAKE